MARKVWKCNKCGIIFDSEAEAVACENNHRPVFGCYCVYQFGEQYPSKIRLTFTDGRKCEYGLIQDPLGTEYWHRQNVEYRNRYGYGSQNKK